MLFPCLSFCLLLSRDNRIGHRIWGGGGACFFVLSTTPELNILDPREVGSHWTSCKETKWLVGKPPEASL